MNRMAVLFDTLALLQPNIEVCDRGHIDHSRTWTRLKPE
jgi:hypothetical protein